MMRTLCLLTCGALVLAAQPASAQMRLECGKRAPFIELLAKKFGESQRWFGPLSKSGVLELYEAPDGKTWTLILSFPDGSTCKLGQGTGSVNFGPAPAGDPA